MCAAPGNFRPADRFHHHQEMEMKMSIEGKAKEAAGYVKEELNEKGDSPEAKRRAQDGRDLRTAGRVHDCKPPQPCTPGPEQYHDPLATPLPPSARYAAPHLIPQPH